MVRTFTTLSVRVNCLRSDATAQPHEGVGDRPLSLRGESQQQTTLTNTGGESMHVALEIRQFLDRAALISPDKVAIVDEPFVPGTLGTLTYAEVKARADGLGAALAARGIEPGGRVAIVSANSAKFLISFFGVSGSGRVLVPINYRLSHDDISYIVNHCGASLILVDPEVRDLVAGSPIPTIVLDGIDDAELFAPLGPREPVRPELFEEDTCSINYTSGTTARPKGVELTHRNCALNAMTFGWHLGVNERDVLLHVLPMFHVNGWGMPYAATAMGATHIVLRKVDGAEILRRIEHEGVTLLCCAPAVVVSILDAAAARSADAPPLRTEVRVVVAGAPPPSKIVERVETELGWEFIQIYGLTETSPLLTINRARSEWDGESPATRASLLARAGVPAVGVTISVSGDGEILARSNHVFRGYYNQPEASAEALADGWFHTGDGGYLDGPFTVITDRKKDVIITGGENVSSIEVEDCLFRHDAVAEVAVIGTPDEKWGEVVTALVVLRPEATATAEELIAHCREHLAHFKAPKRLEFRDHLARTATGKLQKYKLRAEYWPPLHER
jgi:acyl-CoA synthetase (AMP-forming)/AMP-acid ligase II